MLSLALAPNLAPSAFYTARKFHLCISFLGIARPQPQFQHSCVWERFILSQDRSTYFLQQNRQTDRENTVYKSLTDTWIWKLGLRPRYFFSGNICFEISVFCLCSVLQAKLLPASTEKRKTRTGERKLFLIWSCLADGEVQDGARSNDSKYPYSIAFFAYE